MTSINTHTSHSAPSYSPKPSTPVVKASHWYYNDGRPNEPGVRIEAGNTRLFIPAKHVLDVATALADHLNDQKQQDDK